LQEHQRPEDADGQSHNARPDQKTQPATDVGFGITAGRSRHWSKSNKNRYETIGCVWL